MAIAHIRPEDPYQRMVSDLHKGSSFRDVPSQDSSVDEEDSPLLHFLIVIDEKNRSSPTPPDLSVSVDTGCKRQKPLRCHYDYSGTDQAASLW